VSSGCDSVVFLTINTAISTRYVTPEELVIDVNEYLPNIINPNSGTEANRSFGLVAACDINNIKLDVYSRSGSKMFSSIDIDEKWDGTFNGSDVNPGVYLYTLDYERAGEVITKSGTVTKKATSHEL